MDIDNEATSPGTPTIRPLQYLEGFRFFYRDANFGNNLLIGSVFFLIPIVGPIVMMGFMCEVIQRLIRRHPQPIPKLQFGDFGDYLGRGVVPFVVNFVATIPLVILIYAMIFIVILITAGIARSVGEAPALLVGIVGGLVGYMAIVFPASVLLFSVMTFAEISEDFGTAFNFGRVMAYAKRNWKQIIISMLVLIPVTFGLMLGGMIACFIGLYPAIVIMQFIFVHLRWQIYENDLASGGQPIPMKPERTLSSERPAAAPVIPRPAGMNEPPPPAPQS